ncbi:hypothetical protein [Micromonospora echinospora]|uniref:hypothetical protein n=1 Tax=Micromonospora echinospora TaxID=1877 RepID=UPI003A8BE380
MRAGELLRRLDQRCLPPLVRALTGRGGPRPRLLGWVALASVGAVLLTAAWATGRPPVGDRTVGEVTRVGVGEGDSIPGYLRSAGDELAALPDPAPSASAGSTWALVSLAEYLPPERLAPVLADVPVSAVFGRVPLPGRQTQIVRIPALRVPEDVRAGMVELAGRKDREAADYRARGAELTGDTPQERELRGFYASGAEVAEVEAAAYRAGCSCVYAAVVRAEPSRLRTVAARLGVRAVDPAPEIERLDRTVFTPPLPEQEDCPPARRRAAADRVVAPADRPPRTHRVAGRYRDQRPGSDRAAQPGRSGRGDHGRTGAVRGRHVRPDRRARFRTAAVRPATGRCAYRCGPNRVGFVACQAEIDGAGRASLGRHRDRLGSVGRTSTALAHAARPGPARWPRRRGAGRGRPGDGRTVPATGTGPTAPAGWRQRLRRSGAGGRAGVRRGVPVGSGVSG